MIIYIIFVMYFKNWFLFYNKPLPQPLQVTSKGKKILLNNLDIHPPEKDSRSVQGSYSVISTSGLKAYLK